LKVTITVKTLMTAFFIVILCSSCQRTSAPPPKGNDQVEIRVPTDTPWSRSTSSACDDTDVIAGGIITPENAARIEILHILQAHTGHIVAFAFSADDRQLTSLASDFTLKRWDVNSGEELHNMKLRGGPIYNGAISHNGVVFAVEGFGHVIQLRDSQDGKILRKMTGHKAFVMSFTFSADDSLLATADDNGSIIVNETDTGLPLLSLDGHPSPVGALAFSPDNTLLASGGVEGSQDIKIWNLTSGEEIVTFNKHSANVYDLAFSPDGAVLASVSGDRTLKLWDVASGQELQTLRGHRSNIYSVDFSPDGKLLASSDFDGNIKLWDIANSIERNNLKGHTDLVEPIKFSNNGCLLASGAFDSKIIIWGILH
jgi:WD40 repeat protein